MLRELRREKLQAFFHALAGFRRQTENLYSGPHRLNGCPCGIPIELHRIRKFGLGDERNVCAIENRWMLQRLVFSLSSPTSIPDQDSRPDHRRTDSIARLQLGKSRFQEGRFSRTRTRTRTRIEAHHKHTCGSGFLAQSARGQVA